MEREVFISGYCRALDQSRTVTAEKDGSTWEADCAYPDCPHCPSCEIAKRLRELSQNA